MKKASFAFVLTTLLALDPAIAEEEKKVPASLDDLKSQVAEVIE